MKLLNIAATGLKGTSFNYELKGVTVVAGKNKTRKTAVLDAITLGLYNFHPRYGVRGTAELGEMIKVILATSDGTTTRNFKDGKPLSKEPPLAPRVLLDASEFMVKTEAEREAMLFQRCDTSKLGFSETNITAAIKALKLEDHTPDDEKVLATILVDAVAVLEEVRGDPLQEWLPKVIKWLKDQGSSFKAVAKQMTEKIKADAQLAAGQGIQSAPQNIKKLLADEREQASKVEQELAVINGQLTELRATILELDNTTDLDSQLLGLERDAKALEETVAAYRSDTKALEAEHRANADKAGDLMGSIADAKRLSARAMELSTAVNQQGNSTLEEDISTIKKAIDELERERSQFIDMVPQKQEELKGARKELDAIKLLASEAHAKAGRIALQFERDMKKDCCPTCKLPGDKWREFLRKTNAEESVVVAAELVKTQKDCEAADRVVKTLAKQLEAVLDSKKLYDQKVTKITALRHDLEPLELRFHKLALDRAALAEIKAPSVVPLEKELARLEAIQRGHVSAIDKCRAADAACEKDRAELKEMRQEIGDLVVRQQKRISLKAMIERSAPLATLETKHLALSKREIESATRVMQLAQQERQFIAQQAEQLSREQAKARLQEAHRTALLYEQATDTITTLQNNMTELMIQSLMVKCHELTTGFFGSPLTFRQGAFGYWDGRHWVGRKALSGFEEALAMVGLQLALADATPIKLVMIDELGRLDRENRRIFLCHMVKLVEMGKLDNFVATDNDYGFYEAEGIKGLQVIYTKS